MPAAATMPPAPQPRSPDFYLDQIQSFWRATLSWIFTHALQVAIAAAIGAAIVGLMMGARALGLRICRQDALASNWKTVFARAIVRTHVLFMVVVAARLVEGYADTPPDLARTIQFFFTIGFTLQVAVWVRELILGFVEHRAGGPEEHGSLASALGLIRVLVTITLFAVATLMILDNLGVNVTGLVAGLGIGGIAVGLAAKGIFDDLFSALSIIFDRPFRRGDTISWDKTTGTVEAIGLKTTRVRAQTGEEVIVSNTNILSKELHNLARLDRRRVIIPVGLTYDTPPEICAGLPERVGRVVETVPKCVLNRCGMVGFGDSSLDFEVQVDVHTEVLKEIFDARSQVMIAILKDFNDAGIEFAFPTQMTIIPSAPPASGDDGHASGLVEPGQAAS